ncbi:hypothetical protein [Phenylobacterium sp.]|uniref:hypothetical protein n=1 Tax=Phenylobacterium sp. TaxID=1871053 RepID=UPI0012112963|nr:hypothetical protein [Phenylobacterium sp.]THD58147.1 MAG: hypothetical protein E8A49_21035 [Phenylobacterium sp.]
MTDTEISVPVSIADVIAGIRCGLAFDAKGGALARSESTRASAAEFWRAYLMLPGIALVIMVS